MNITKKIKSYEDACKVLGLNPENQLCVDSVSEKDRNSIIAYHKLIVIIRALNEGWEADFTNHDQYKYFPWFAYRNNTAGFGSVNTYYAATSMCPSFGSRLCFKNKELVEYAIHQFKSLYEEYLLIK